MDSEKLVIGMPAGSLADPQRGGNLVNLLKAAGFPTKGYDQGGPTKFPLNSVLLGWDGRPQEFGSQLALDEIDLAISGDDWIRERMLEFKYEHGHERELTRVMSLGRGGVRIVIINRAIEGGISFDQWLKGLLQEKPLLTMVSEMPYLALDWFQRKIHALGFTGTHAGWSVQKYCMPPKIEHGLVIYETWGKTEAKVLNGSVDFGMEITQSGSAIRNYGLQISDEVLESETAIYANPRIKDNPEKYELARMFLMNLYGAMYAENKVLMFFNAKKSHVMGILGYLRTNHLFADEPTMNEGATFTEFSVQMDTANPELPLAKVRWDLANLGATHIETVPLDSCIPSLENINI